MAKESSNLLIRKTPCRITTRPGDIKVTTRPLAEHLLRFRVAGLTPGKQSLDGFPRFTSQTHMCECKRKTRLRFTPDLNQSFLFTVCPGDNSGKTQNFSPAHSTLWMVFAIQAKAHLLHRHSHSHPPQWGSQVSAPTVRQVLHIHFLQHRGSISPISQECECREGKMVHI